MIYKKLLEFQKKNITVEKNETNPFFNSKYTTLNEVLAKVRKPLNDLGILIVQLTQRDGLQTILLDTEDDSKVECLFPYVEVGTAQKVGANITYGRRYSLVALLGLEDEDDDGNSTSETKAPHKELPKAVYGRSNYSPAGLKGKPATEKQKNYILSLAEGKGIEMGLDDVLNLDGFQASQKIEELKNLPSRENLDDDMAYGE